MDDNLRKELAEAGRRKLEEFRRRKQQQGDDVGGGSSRTAVVVVEGKQEEEKKDVMVMKTNAAFPGATAIMGGQSSGSQGKNETQEGRLERVVDDDSDASTSGTKYKAAASILDSKDGEEGSNADKWADGNDLVGKTTATINVSSFMNLSSSKDMSMTTAKDACIGNVESPEQGTSNTEMGARLSFHATDYLVRGGVETTSGKEEAVLQGIDVSEDAVQNKKIDDFEAGVKKKKEGVEEVSVDEVKNDVSLSDPREQHARRKEFERLEEHIDKLTSEKIDLNLCLEKQTELVHRITDENETMIRRLNEASSRQERLMEKLGEYEKDKVDMQSLIQEYTSKLETKEKEAKDFETKMRVLGNELVRLEEDLLREKNERLRVSSLSSNQEMENGKEAAWEKERFILESQREQMKRALDALQGSLEEAEAKIAEYEKQQHAVPGHDGVARKIPSLPHSAIIAAQAMEEHQNGSESATISSIPLEIQALLPRTTWIPGIETLQTDIHQAAERIFAHIKQMEDRQGTPLTDRLSSENTEIKS